MIEPAETVDRFEGLRKLPEGRLWMAVLQSAYHDLRDEIRWFEKHPKCPVEVKGRKCWRNHHERVLELVLFFGHGSSRFEWICETLGYDAAEFRAQAEKLFTELRGITGDLTMRAL